MRKTIYALTLLLFSVASVSAFQGNPPAPVKPDSKKAKPKAKPTPRKPPAKPKFKKYSDVITDKAKTKKGVFTTHEVEGKYYFEIDPKMFGREFLWLVQMSRVEEGVGLGGTEVARHVVRFERLQDNVLLRRVSHRLRADEGSSEQIAVDASSLDATIASMKIVTFGKDKTPVIEMTPMFKSDVNEFSPKRRLNALAIDRGRVFVTSMKTFEKNIETRVLATYRLRPPRPSANPFARFTARQQATVELHHSMVELPEKPMRPRVVDNRVGFFSGTHLDFSSDKNEAKPIRYVRRWRLEKKNPGAAMSEPVKPIVFYVGRGVPKKYQKATLEGIEMWQSAFEKAGFKNGIIAKMAPTKEEDPDWDAEDARYSTIRWMASEIRNAQGPHVQDPRSGEILEADVRMFHNVIALLEDWYFVQAGASDPRAAKLPFGDELMAELVKYVVAHEVGHTLGLRHNMLGNNAYPVESYRDIKFVEKYGMSSSIMDYARFNYIAQPEDNVVYIPNKVGPYDHFAIEWGYTEFDNSKPLSSDKPGLDKIAERQLTNPMFRFGWGGDPRAQTEDIGDDAMKATTYGMKNLERITGNLVSSAVTDGEDFSRLARSYNSVAGQMSRELGHVVSYIGGIERDNLVGGQSRADAFRPTPVAKQKEAMAFSQKHAFHVKDFMLNKEIVQRIGMQGIVTRFSGIQSRFMRRILSDRVVTSVNDLSALGYDVYQPVEIFDDMRAGIFSELYDKKAEPNVFRRNLHMATVDHLLSSVDAKSRASADFKALSRAMLQALQADLARASGRTKNRMSKLHYSSLADRIALGLAGK